MTAGATYVSIASQTLSSTATEITFSSIPATYTDLALVISCAQSTAGGGLRFQFNSDTSGNYSTVEIGAYEDTVYQARPANATGGYITYNVGVPVNQLGASTINFMNYSNSTTYKTVIGDYVNASDNGRGYDLTFNLWRNTAAITTIKMFLSANNFIVGSTFSLYGIKAA